MGIGPSTTFRVAAGGKTTFPAAHAAAASSSQLRSTLFATRLLLPRFLSDFLSDGSPRAFDAAALVGAVFPVTVVAVAAVADAAVADAAVAAVACCRRGAVGWASASTSSALLSSSSSSSCCSSAATRIIDTRHASAAARCDGALGHGASDSAESVSAALPDASSLSWLSSLSQYKLERCACRAFRLFEGLAPSLADLGLLRLHALKTASEAAGGTEGVAAAMTEAAMRAARSAADWGPPALIHTAPMRHACWLAAVAGGAADGSLAPSRLLLQAVAAASLSTAACLPLTFRKHQVDRCGTELRCIAMRGTPVTTLSPTRPCGDHLHHIDTARENPHSAVAALVMGGGEGGAP